MQGKNPELYKNLQFDSDITGLDGGCSLLGTTQKGD
jgi:hypothetical protein